MRTNDFIMTMIQTEGAASYREYAKTLREAVATLEQIHAEHYTTNDTPAQTVEKYVAAVGYDLAAAVVASMVNRAAWDGRISNQAKTWAATIKEGHDEESANRLCLYSNKIHMVHLDQIACAFAKYERPTDPEGGDKPTEGQESDKNEEPAEHEAEGVQSDTEAQSAAPWVPAVGDIVRVSGGYHANSNGLFFIEAESGRGGWWLKPITKAGKLRKASDQSWPLVSYMSDRLKAAEAKRHNQINAKMEPAPEVPACYVADFFRTQAAELAEKADNQERRGYARAAETRASAEKAAKIAARFPADDVPPAEKKPAPIRFYWNGIKINGGDLVKCHFSPNDGEGVTIYARDYKDLPREYFLVTNGSDIMTDYFEQDRAEVEPEHPLYKYVRFVALKAIATGHSWRKLTEDQAAEWATLRDPGQPTEAEAEAARAWLTAQREGPENARREAEQKEREAEAARAEYQRTEGAKFIQDTATVHPIREGSPVVTVLWSEHPAFYGWEDGELRLSVAAADIILKHFDEEQHNARENGGDQFGPCAWCYFKTKYQIEYTDPETGKPETFVDRYDLGDGLGGLVTAIEKYNGENHPFVQLLREHTAGGRVVSVTFAPWLQKAMQRREQQARHESVDVFSMVEMLTEEQLEAAIMRLDHTDPQDVGVAQFFAQELMRRDREKAVDVWKRWKCGEKE